MPNADEVFASLADAAIRLAYNNPSAYNPKNVSNALWAFAKAGRSHPQLYAALGPVGASIARNFSMQALANVCDMSLTASSTVASMAADATSRWPKPLSVGAEIEENVSTSTPSTRWCRRRRRRGSLLNNTGRLGLRAEPRAVP